MDSDYRGPVSVLLSNHGSTDYDVTKGQRIAQFILEKILMPEVVEVEVCFPTLFQLVAVYYSALLQQLEPTWRGTGAFGSSGR